MDAKYLHEFFNAYVECALWASTDNSNEETGGEPMDRNYGPDDIAPDDRELMYADCERFYTENESDIDAGPCKSIECKDHEYAGHDFWLTRNGHGANFLDGDWPEPAATRLYESAKSFGEVNLYVGDGGKIHVM